MPAKPQVLVLGGGFAALESAFLLRMRLGEQVDIRLVSDRDHFVFRPNSIYVPFGADPASLLVGLRKPLARRHINFERGSVAEVDPDARFVQLDRRAALPLRQAHRRDGRRHARRRRSRASPSTRRRSGRTDSMLDVRRRFERGARSRARRRAPAGAVPRPAEQQVLRARCTRSCSCSRPGCAARARASTSTSPGRPTRRASSRRSGRGCTNSSTARVRRARDRRPHRGGRHRGRCRARSRYADGSARGFDHLIAFPPYVAAVRYAALPSDERGFVDDRARDPAGRRATTTSTRPATPATSRSSRRSSRSCRPTPSPSTSPPTSPAAPFERAVRPGEHVHHGDVRQGDLRPGADRADRRPGAPGARAPGRRRRLQGRHVAGLAAGQEDARLHRAGALRGRRAVPRRAASGR